VVVSLFATVLVACGGLLMVSNFQYLSFKKVDMRRRVPFALMLLLVLVLGVVTIDPPSVLLLMAIAYALSGPGLLLWQRAASRKAD
jgi:CDP-diacylglycerol--serine O-phosphatidyltransferase